MNKKNMRIVDQWFRILLASVLLTACSSSPTRSLILTDEQFQKIEVLDATMANREQVDFAKKYRDRFRTSSEISNAMLTGKWEEARSDFQTNVALMLNFWPDRGPDQFVLTNLISGDISSNRWVVEGRYQLLGEKLKLEIERVHGNLPVWVESKILESNHSMGEIEMTMEVTTSSDVYIIGIRFGQMVLYVDDL